MLIRGTLTDYYDLPLTQEQADFAIPFPGEGIALYVPFLLWKSAAQPEKALHRASLAAFEGLPLRPFVRRGPLDSRTAKEVRVGGGRARSRRWNRPELACEIIEIGPALEAKDARLS